MSQNPSFMLENITEFPMDFDVSFIHRKIKEHFRRSIYESICHTVGESYFVEIDFGEEITFDVLEEVILELEERGFVCGTSKAEPITSETINDVFDDGSFFVYFVNVFSNY